MKCIFHISPLFIKCHKQWIRRPFVDNSITDDDTKYIKKILDDKKVQPLWENPKYEDEVAFIRAVQRAILQFVPYEENKGPLPYGEPREPKDIYKHKDKYGACCDRSRLIEKILRKHGFTTRHVFIISTEDTGCILGALLPKALLPKVDMHSVSEVLTKKGWLVVDSNSDWMPLDKKNHPHSMKSIRYEKQILWKKWQKPMCLDMKAICEGPFTFFYGLYSRRGWLYPPFFYVSVGTTE